MYAAGAPSGPMWADSAKLTLYALHGYLPSLSPGDHAGWTLLARLWLALLGGDPVTTLHLFSAVAGAAAVALVFALTARRYGDSRVAHGAASLIAVAHSHWWAASVTESYPLAIALALGGIWAVERKGGAVADAAAGVAAGLALASHAMSVVLTAPALATVGRRRWVPVGIGLLLGAAPLWLAAFGAPADPLTGHRTSRVGSVLWHLAAFVEPDRAPLGFALVAALLAYGCGPIGVAALARAVRREVAGAGAGRFFLSVGVLAPLVVLLTLYLPARVHLMLGFVVVGLVVAAPPRLTAPWVAAHLASQVALYLLVPAALVGLDGGSLGVRELPYRTNAWYFLCPVKRLDAGPETYARTLLGAAPPGAVVLADFNPGALLRLVQERCGLRPDVTVVPTAIDEILAQPDPALVLARRISATDAPVVLADRWEPYYRAAEMQRRFAAEIRPCGPGLLVRLTPAPPLADGRPRGNRNRAGTPRVG